MYSLSKEKSRQQYFKLIGCSTLMYCHILCFLLSQTLQFQPHLTILHCSYRAESFAIQQRGGRLREKQHVQKYCSLRTLKLRRNPEAKK